MNLAHDRARLLVLMRELSFERRKVILASGKESDFYVDCKRTALTAEGHVLVGRLLFDRIRQVKPLVRGAGGLTLGADPLASAVAYTSFLAGEPVDAFIVRKEPKGHGTGQWIEGRKTIPDGSRVSVLEDVITTGGSAIKAIERCRAEGLVVAGCFALVDRMEGGARPSRPSVSRWTRSSPGAIFWDSAGHEAVPAARAAPLRIGLHLPHAGDRPVHAGRGLGHGPRRRHPHRQALRRARRRGLRHRHLAVGRGAGRAGGPARRVEGDGAGREGGAPRPGTGRGGRGGGVPAGPLHRRPAGQRPRHRQGHLAGGARGEREASRRSRSRCWS